MAASRSSTRFASAKRPAAEYCCANVSTAARVSGERVRLCASSKLDSAALASGGSVAGPVGCAAEAAVAVPLSKKYASPAPTRPGRSHEGMIRNPFYRPERVQVRGLGRGGQRQSEPVRPDPWSQWKREETE